MRMPTALRSLDERVLGSRKPKGDDPSGTIPPDDDLEPHRKTPDSSTSDRSTSGSGTSDRTQSAVRPAVPRRPSTGDGAREALTVVYRVSRVVLLLLAAAVVLGIVFVLAPTNPDNSIVRLVMDLADGAAGPFIDVFTVADNAERELVVNYAFAAVVYAVLASLVLRLPGGKR